MTEKMIELGNKVIDSADDYFNEFAKEHGKKGFLWVRNEETGQLVVYTRGEYTNKIVEFLDTLT